MFRGAVRHRNNSGFNWGCVERLERQYLAETQTITLQPQLNFALLKQQLYTYLARDNHPPHSQESPTAPQIWRCTRSLWPIGRFARSKPYVLLAACAECERQLLIFWLQELEFLADNDLITPAQLSTILNQLPSETATGRGGIRNSSPAPVAAMNNLNVNGNGRQNETLNEKASFYGNQSNPSPAPPAYPVAPAPPTAPPLTYATALYAYNASDPGDLALQANDRVAVTEYMNAEWWKGRNERTKQEGIFPRNYVKVEEKITEPPAPTNYGNMPLDVSNGAAEPSKAGKGQEMGKKFGKKLGNAAVFGAGATIGSNIVNSIF